jgi:subtilisin
MTMAEQSKDFGQPRPIVPPAAAAARPASAAPPNPAPDANAAETLASRKAQYMIGGRVLPGMPAMPTELVLQALAAIPEVEIVRRVRPRTAMTASAGGIAPAGEIIVARMDARQGEALRRNAAPNLIVDPDEPLRIADALAAEMMRPDVGAATIPWPCRSKEIDFHVVGPDDKPVAGADIFVFGSGLPAQAATDAAGRATVAFYDAQNEAPDGLAGVAAVYVRPAADYWDRFVREPMLVGGANLVRLRPLSENFSSSTTEPASGWGRRIMQLDRLADRLDGAGVRIGFIDSGCDNTHPLLAGVTRGADLTDPGNANGWIADRSGHGTHCAGIIAADPSAASVVRLRGIAPGAELHVFKVFPGGRCSDLIDALDQCIERQLDIVGIGVGSARVSELVAQKFAEARRNGIACITAAGGWPGLLPPAAGADALAVAALGRLGEFPPDTLHAQTAIGQVAGGGGLFIPSFVGSAPPAAVGGPGVAIVSTVPGGGCAARDGSAAAVAHIAGFAALLLAHYPPFQAGYATRGEQRVMALFEAIRASCGPLPAGSGLADPRCSSAWAFPGTQAIREGIAAGGNGFASAAAAASAAGLAAPNGLMV